MDNPNNKRDPVGAISAGIAIVSLGFVLVIVFLQIDAWSMKTFARPPLAAALIAVLDLALFAVAIALSPALSEVLRRIGRMIFRSGDKASDRISP